MTIYSDLTKKFYSVTERILEFFYNWAASPPGFLKLVLSMRFIVLIVITVNFGYLFIEQDMPALKGMTSWVIWSYFLFILFLLSLAILKPDEFESLSLQTWQVVLDAIVIAFLYWISISAKDQTASNIFLLYFLPLLVTARFLGVRAAVLLIAFIVLASCLTWLLELENQEIFSAQYWFTKLLPQLSFLLILTIFYFIYYRRRKMGERLQTMALVLEEQIGHLWLGWFSVDRDLRITAMDMTTQQRHGSSQNGMTCAQVFCQDETSMGRSCSHCPMSRSIGTGKSVTNNELVFTDRGGAKYHAQLIAYPVLNGNQEIVGANGWVYDLDERKTFRQGLRIFADDLERVVDQNRQEDRAHVRCLANQLEAISQASESALSPDVFRGADEIVRAIVLLLGCRLATVRQHQIDEETGQEALVVCNHFGVDQKDVSRISFLNLDSSSLVVRAFKTGEVQYVEDLQNSGLLKYEEIFQRYELRSMACFPLIIQGRAIGTFTLFRNKRQGFSEEDLQLVRATANIMASLVSSQRQITKDQQESFRRKRELDILNSLSQNLVTIDDPHVLAQLVADTIRREMHVETASVFLTQDNVLYRSAISGAENDWFKEEKYQVGEGLTGKAALPEPGQLFGKRVLENDLENNELVILENLVRHRLKFISGKACHLLAVPLNGLRGTFGVLRVINKLGVADRLDKNGFSEHEAELMTTMACIVAIAMESARLFLMEKKKRMLEQALRHGARNMSSTLEERIILETILAQLKKVVHYDSASLFLEEEDGLRLKSMTGFGEEDMLQLRHICLDPEFNPPFRMMKADHQPVLVDDLWEKPLLEPIIGTHSIRSWIGAPLIIKDQIIGWLSVDNWLPNQYTPEDVEITQDFAQQAAIAIDNARQYRLQKEQATFLLELEKHLVQITSSADKRAAMNSVALAAGQLMNCEMAGVAIYDKEKEEIRALPGIGYVGVPEEYASSFSFPLDHSGGQVLQEKKVFFSRDASMDSESIFGYRLIQSINAKGVIASPLMVGDHIVGVLYAASQSPKNWTDSQITFFSILSNHAAIAIRNSELLDLKERRAQLLDLLQNLSTAGQLTNNPEAIYNILLTAVTAEYGLRFNRALLLLYDKGSNVLRGFTGIGQLESSEAYHLWGSLDDHSHSFDGHINDVLSNGILHYSSLHYKAKNLTIPVRVDSEEVFSRVFLSGNMELVNPAKEQGKLNDDFYRIFDTNPFVIAPLLVNNEVMGMLVVDNKITGEPIRQMELDLLKSCASQAAAAIHRSNLHQQVEERIHVLEHLQELTRAFSELAEPREVLRRIAEATNDVLHADFAYLVPYDPDRMTLLVEEAVTAGTRSEFQHEGTFSTYGLTSMAMQEPGRLVVIEDLKAQKDLRSRFVEQEDIHSVAVYRLELRKNIVGMLYINYRRPHWFSELELATLHMLAGQAAVAINNARLLMQNEALATQRERDRLRDDLHDVLNTYAFKVMEPAESILEKESRKRRRDTKLIEEAEELWRFSRHTYQQLERILEDMREPILVERGLSEALRVLVNSRLPRVEPVIRGEIRPPADVELVLYRICQEAISNVQKHANISKEGNELVNIILELDTHQCRLIVQDFGCGFSPEILNDRKKGIGLQAMRNWAYKISAQINIQSNPGKGTFLEVVAPISEKEHGHE